MFYPNNHPKYRENSLNRAIAENRLTEDDARLIRMYVTQYQAVKHVGEQQAQRAALALVQWRRFILVPFDQAKIEQIYEAINAMQAADSLKGKPFHQNTKHDYVKHLRGFLIWLIEDNHSSIPLEKIRKIRVPVRDLTTTTPDEILTQDEIREIIDACQGAEKPSRDRAMLMTLYESGCRVGELARLRWKDVVFDEYGTRLTITDRKTNKIRYVRLVMATEYLARWKNEGPAGRGPGDLVFISAYGLELTHPAIYMMQRRTVERAGIKKRVYPHLFRKSRITHLIQQNYQESVVKKMMWGNLGTNMFRTYAVLSTADIDAEVLDRSGIVKKEQAKTDKLEVRQCPNCLKLNAPTDRYCTCGMALTLEAMNVQEAMKQTLKQDPEKVLELIKELLGK